MRERNYGWCWISMIVYGLVFVCTMVAIQSHYQPSPAPIVYHGIPDSVGYPIVITFLVGEVLIGVLFIILYLKDKYMYNEEY